jgi:hypothetical protein
MAYPVDNILNVNLLLTPGGLGFANFATAFVIARDADLLTTGSIAAGTYKDYSSLSQVAEDVDTDSDTYLIATRWFANTPKPLQLSVWIWDEVADTSVIDTMNKANNEAWRYFYFLPADVYSVEATALELSDWSAANSHPVPLTLTGSEVVDPQSAVDLASVLQTKGNRHMFVGYVPQSIIDTDPSQQYAMVQLMAAFSKFRPLGTNTAITGEYQVLPGVIGARDQLNTTAYNALEAKNVVFFTAVELQGSIDNSRVLNSKSMSSFGEFIDDVINLDVLKNYLQVNGYNYITGTPTKRALTERGYAGLLDTISQTCQQFYKNGVLGESNYVDPNDGVTKLAKFGFVNFGQPEDVLGLTVAQKRDRVYPETAVLAILARAGHSATINVTVE